MDEVYYCGFNGFHQVPSQAEKHTITSLVPQTPASKGGANVSGRTVVDVAICWNYLVVVEPDAVTKYGLVDGKHGQARLSLPSSEVSKSIRQLSASPRHLLAVTNAGECWTHEEGKGWRRVYLEAEQGERLIDFSADPAAPSMPDASQDSHSVRLIKTDCGDAHNLGLDSNGVVYSLPSPLQLGSIGTQHRVTDVACGKEHSLLLTEYGQVWSWGSGSRGQLGHGALCNEEKPRVVSALDGMRMKKIAAGGWHSAVISHYDDLYMFGWNESGQLAMPTILAKPAECFSAVEKLLMACCTMQPEDAALPRGDAETYDGEVYHKNEDEAASLATSGSGSRHGQGSCRSDGAGNSFNADSLTLEAEKDALTCYNSASCNSDADLVVVQTLPMLVSFPNSSKDLGVIDVGCGSRHTVVLTKDNNLWAFGWNKYGQLGLGHTINKDTVEKVALPKSISRNSEFKMLRCGDWGTAIVVTNNGGKKSC